MAENMREKAENKKVVKKKCVCGNTVGKSDDPSICAFKYCKQKKFKCSSCDIIDKEENFALKFGGKTGCCKNCRSKYVVCSGCRCAIRRNLTVWRLHSIICSDCIRKSLALLKFLDPQLPLAWDSKLNDFSDEGLIRRVEAILTFVTERGPAFSIVMNPD